MSDQALFDALNQINLSVERLGEHGTLEIISMLSPAAILLSAVAAIIIGWRTLQSQRRIARTRATLDVLLKLHVDTSFQKSAAIFRDVRDGRGLLSLLENDSKKSKRDDEEELFVDHYLNTLELLCVGMSENTIDERYVYQYLRGSLIHDWHSAKMYALESRDKFENQRLFQKFELFATHWERHVFVMRAELAEKYFNANVHAGYRQK